jgi:hypothetical protein
VVQQRERGLMLTEARQADSKTACTSGEYQIVARTTHMRVGEYLLVHEHGSEDSKGLYV